MLALTVKTGDYATIGPDIVIQVLTAGEMFRTAIDAPRETRIARARVHALTGSSHARGRAARQPRGKEAPAYKKEIEYENPTQHYGEKRLAELHRERLSPL